MDALDDRHFASVGLTREAAKQLQVGLQGTLVYPGDPNYNTDRQIFNPAFQSYPYVIVYCAVEWDVALAINVSQGSNLPFMMRSGGHCTAGFSTGPGMLIDVSGLNSISIDPAGMTATVGCGVTFGNFRAALSTYGLHVPGGECDDVCIGGYVQGGGYGFSSVTYGMNCDNVVSLRAMLYDGSIVEASETVNSDLWWALRGGTGGTMAALLSVTYKLVSMGDVFGWAIGWPLQDDTQFTNAANALLFLQENYSGAATNPQQNIQVTLCYQPSLVGGLPPGSPMYPYLLLRGLWVGDADSGNTAIAPLLAQPGAYLQWTEVADFSTLNDNLLNKPYGLPDISTTPMPNEDKASRYVAAPWSQDDYMGLLRYFVTTPNQYSYFYMEFYGGAINKYPVGNSAFIHRDVLYNAVLDVFWYPGQDPAPVEAYLQGWLEFMETRYNGHVYQNYPRLGEPNYAFKYWGTAKDDLWHVKNKYDPYNLFTFAQVVPPPPVAAKPAVPAGVTSPALAAALAKPISYLSTRTQFRPAALAK
jgi:hypothetical protein